MCHRAFRREGSALRKPWTGMPPTPIMPGFQVVARSAGRNALESMLPAGDTTASVLADSVGSAPSTVPPPVAGPTFQVSLLFTAPDTAACSACRRRSGQAQLCGSCGCTTPWFLGVDKATRRRYGFCN